MWWLQIYYLTLITDNMKEEIVKILISLYKEMKEGGNITDYITQDEYKYARVLSLEEFIERLEVWLKNDNSLNK